ncbi:Septum formation protein Maf [Anaerobiospirillum thomasii]|uniref:Maf family protein n=1 Tax=Anaerobiospirillum thomasii TaxID=179995 RepID=UPI000D83363B|nr:Maf family protein [Anaerobiospirillum thomasii]SPT72358.1 Septum formation protein Maf [Anaerobiospirillum thomasii]
MYKLILASQSPRRRDFLKNMGLEFEIYEASIDEKVDDGELVGPYVVRMASKKADTVIKEHTDAVVIGADTVIALEGRILGKPKDREDALNMILSLSGKRHEVHTAVCVRDSDRKCIVQTVTYVTFANISKELAQIYVDSGECDDKSGSYALQGIGAMLIEKVEGSVSSVVGMPASQTRELLEKFGIYPKTVKV